MAKHKSKNLLDLILDGLYAAQCTVNQKAKQTGEPIIVWKDGKIVKMTPALIDQELQKLQSKKKR